MKKLLLYSIIIICSNLSAVTFDGGIIAKSNYRNLLYIYRAEYKNEIGFKVDHVYFLTSKKQYYKTINTPYEVFEWNVYTNTNGEYLRNHKPVYALCSYNKDNVVFTFYMDVGNVLNNVVITFKRGEL
jgi:hypothetical protein